MRAVVIERFGEPKDVLATAERPVPEPGPGEVRLALILSPIHNHDLAIVRGVYGYRPELPAIPGSEAVARVDAVGPEVGDLSVGQRVTVSGAQNVWAEYFVVPARQVIPLPDAVSDETAAQLLAMPLSALMLIEDLELSSGDWLTINAANGAVGRLVNVFARQRGLNVLNLVRGPASVAALRELGYEPVLDTESEGWRDQVEAATSGAPILRAVDQVGGRAAAAELALLAPGGQLISFGALSGQPLSLDPGALIFKEVVIKGFWGAKRIEEIGAEHRGRLIRELIALAADGVLRLDIEAAYPLEEAADAAVATETPGRAAKVALRGQPA
ncbi:zinc-binding dehydrogenase [Nocardia gamkensis]|uniref:Zinc-binding dehydrogenase n=1 Tax=Nocardia gamkensis TaxID=352869 RepID=A0A7X6L5U9_9NOCA|nr:zinc-binding dehydrogenase [Nocardia gamkensis]NKY28416.1 zinc-binding dehydrogenase [Nocardia gamkensis]NQE69202.1 Trans-2-enoyl-CoA reductase, mitochondrial [Nocardia gamkensis]